MSDCIFCRIIAGEIPSTKVYEDDKVLAFYDLNPLAPVHFLIIPKTHIDSAAGIDGQNSAVVGHIFEVAARLSAELDLNGFRIVTNCGETAGQTVRHLHFHVLSGRELGVFA